MLYGEMIAVCSEIHRKDTNALRGQNVKCFVVELVVNVITTGS
jgi:hypothetical protein